MRRGLFWLVRFHGKIQGVPSNIFMTRHQHTVALFKAHEKVIYIARVKLGRFIGREVEYMMVGSEDLADQDLQRVARIPLFRLS